MAASSRPESLTSTPSSEKNVVLNSILSNARVALEAAAELAPLIPVPFVSTIFASAQAIVNSASQVKQNKRNCASIAEKVAVVARDIRQAVRSREKFVDDALRSALDQVDRDLQDVRAFLEVEANRPLFSRIFTRDNIQDQLVALQARIDDSMQTFKTTSSLRLEMKLEQVNLTVTKMDGRLEVMDRRAMGERKWDGQFRVYRLAEINFGRTISSERRFHYSPSCPGEQAVIEEELATATVKGGVVAVKNFRGPSSVYKGSLNALKSLRHNNIAQVMGYSDGDDMKYMVLKGDLRRFDEYIDSQVAPHERYSLYVRGMMATLSGHYYLCMNNLIWLGNVDDLMFDASTGQVVLGAQDDFMPVQAPGVLLKSSISSSYTANFVELLPSIINDWDRLRDRISYQAQCYQPVLLPPTPPDESSKSHQVPQSAILAKYSAFSSSPESAIRNLLIDRIQSDPWWYKVIRNIGERNHPVGTIVAFDGGNGHAYENIDDNQQDYVVLDRVPVDDGDRSWWWADMGRGFKTALTEPTDVLEPIENDASFHNFVYNIMHEGNAWSMLIKHGPEIARLRKVKLRNLGFQWYQAQHMYARYRAVNSNGKGEAKDCQPLNEVYFHTRKSHCDWYDEPWGYFSHDREPVSIEQAPPMEDAFAFEYDYGADVEDNDESITQGIEGTDEEDIADADEVAEDPYNKEFRSTLPSIDGNTKQHYQAKFVMLYPDQADMLEWIHSASFSTPMQMDYRSHSYQL